MLRCVIPLSLSCAACGVAPQPESDRAVAAFEVPLPSAIDRANFIATLQNSSRAYGYHVDAATPEELRTLSKVSPISLNATVWRGNDEEVVASAMDMSDHLGRVWISFFKGQDFRRFAAFRQTLMAEITKRWPRTASLPIMPSGAIPLSRDLVLTPAGYQVKPSAVPTYQVQPR
jgi:hypothetical protein